LAQTKKQAQAAQTAVQSIPANLYNQASPGSAPMVTNYFHKRIWAWVP
jgi:hypothetical protein